jgi:hypothetical protein
MTFEHEVVEVTKPKRRVRKIKNRQNRRLEKQRLKYAIQDRGATRNQRPDGPKEKQETDVQIEVETVYKSPIRECA